MKERKAVTISGVDIASGVTAFPPRPAATWTGSADGATVTVPDHPVV